jgi:hypothetical protein
LKIEQPFQYSCIPVSTSQQIKTQEFKHASKAPKALPPSQNNALINAVAYIFGCKIQA